MLKVKNISDSPLLEKGFSFLTYINLSATLDICHHERDISLQGIENWPGVTTAVQADV